MTDYSYANHDVAYDPNAKALIPNASWTVYAGADTSFVTPLTVKTPQGLTLSTVTSDGYAVLQDFVVTDQASVWLVSGAHSFKLTSLDGVLADAQAAAAAASAAQTAAQNAADTISAAPALLPAGGNVGDVLTKSAERVGVWSPPPTGGGAGLTSYAQVASLTGYPATFPPSAHTHAPGEIRGSTAVGQSLLTAADAATARGAISAAPSSTVSFPGFGTTAGTAAQGNHTHQAQAIGYVPAAGNGMASTDVNGALNELAARPTGGSGSLAFPVQVPVSYNTSTSTWPTRPTGLPAGSVVVWDSPVSVGQPPSGGAYAVVGVDKYQGRAG